MLDEDEMGDELPGELKVCVFFFFLGITNFAKRISGNFILYGGIPQESSVLVIVSKIPF